MWVAKLEPGILDLIDDVARVICRLTNEVGFTLDSVSIQQRHPQRAAAGDGGRVHGVYGA